MHMADALISPSVGLTMWTVTAGLIAWCGRKVKATREDRLIPMMGVLGAFIFSAQMINFAIPATGSSGHLGGGLMLAVLLGPYAAFLVMASVLTVQSLFFADGGLLALGCNIFNLGFFPTFIAYPLLYKVMAGTDRTGFRAWLAAIMAGIAGLQLGALCVVLETTLSAISALPFSTFILIMLPIHLAIGIVEGLATAAVIAFVARARPESMTLASPAPPHQPARSLQAVFIALFAAALFLGGLGSWFASSHPDGLEWAITRVTGQAELAGQREGLPGRLAAIQAQTAILPDYGFKPPEQHESAGEPSAPATDSWPAVEVGTSVAGMIGGVLTLASALLIGFVLKARAKVA